MQPLSTRDLLRSPEGMITRGEFCRGALLVIGLCLGAFAVFQGIRLLSASMAWMTVAVAPIAGLFAFFIAASLVYFWYCVFAKRLRGMNRPLFLLNAWVATIVLFGAARLVQYQNDTLGLSSGGLLSQAGTLAMLAGLAFSLLFVALLAMCWFGPDQPVADGQCFPGAVSDAGETAGSAAPKNGADKAS